MCLDQQWYYWNGTQLVASTLDVALAQNQLLTLSSANHWAVPALSALAINATSLALALKVVGTASGTPEVYAVNYTLVQKDVYAPCLLSSFDSVYGEIGIQHQYPDFTRSTIKNKGTTSVTVVLKALCGI